MTSERSATEPEGFDAVTAARAAIDVLVFAPLGLGVKLIDERGNVSFSNVSIVGDNTGLLNPGIWVTGLNGNVNLVTVGQEIVFPGQQVESNFEWSTN